MADGETRICIGVVTGARGLKGELRIKPLTAEPEAVGRYGPVETEDGTRRLTLRDVHVSGSVVAAFVDGVTSRTEADRLKGARLYVRRSALPEPGPDELYAVDLAGLEVRAADGHALGTVATVQNFGAGDLLEITLMGRRDTVMLPYTGAFVPEVNVGEGYLVVTPPDGWSDRATRADKAPA